MKILENKLINKAELARQVWPDVKSPESRLIHKMSGERNFTKSDIERIEKVLTKLMKNIEKAIEKVDII